MMLHKTFLIVLSLSLLISCSSIDPVTVTETRIVTPAIAIVPRPRPVDLSSMQWRVVTNENIDEFLQSVLVTDTEYVFYGITVRDYEKLALNVDDLKRYILQQQEIVAYYESSVLTPADTQ